MKKEDKGAMIEQLASEVSNYSHFYVADISGLNAEQTSDLRRACHAEDIKLLVVKNTLFSKALEKSDVDFGELPSSLKGSSSILFSNTGNAPAKLIKKFHKEVGKPVLKAAYVEESIYIGEDQLPALVSIKSKDELIGEVITLLQSPAKNVVSALQSGGSKLSGIVKTLSERSE